MGTLRGDLTQLDTENLGQAQCNRISPTLGLVFLPCPQAGRLGDVVKLHAWSSGGSSEPLGTKALESPEGEGGDGDGVCRWWARSLWELQLAMLGTTPRFLPLGTPAWGLGQAGGPLLPPSPR